MVSNGEFIEVNDSFFSIVMLVSLSHFYCLVSKDLRELSDPPALPQTDCDEAMPHEMLKSL